MDIGFASRAFSATETVALGAKSGTYCVDAIVVVVNAKNTVLTNASTELIHNIYTGVTKTWDELAK